MSMERDKKIPESVLPHISQGIIVDILTRTAVKDLSRFKCVSKSWLSMISSPKFIKSHLQSSSANRNVIVGYSFRSRKVTLYTCSLGHYMMNYKSVEHKNLIKLEFDFDLLGKPQYLVFVGSSNGLCCLCCIGTTYSSLILLNPSTRKWKLISKPVLKAINDSYGMLCNSIGFAYDDSCDDYKIVYFQPWLKKREVLRIYSLRTNSWSKIETDYAAPMHPQGPPAFLNGKLHWVVKPVGSEHWSVMSYDLKTGSVGQLMQHRGAVFVRTFGVFSGHLYFEDGGELWIMSEYGVDESWKKIASYCSKGSEFRWDFDLSSIEMGADGHGTLDDCVFQYQQQYKTNSLNYCKYIESLVSPTFEGDTSLPVVQGKDG